jgi:hypothetical protein
MVSTYWAELPAYLARHPDVTGRFVRGPARPPTPEAAATAFLLASAVHLGLAVAIPANGTFRLTSCA